MKTLLAFTALVLMTTTTVMAHNPQGPSPAQVAHKTAKIEAHTPYVEARQATETPGSKGHVRDSNLLANYAAWLAAHP